MSQEIDYSQFDERTLTDYMKFLAWGLYILAFALFILGYWFDWKSPGTVVIGALVVADDPHANSGLFVGAFVLVILGFLIVKIAGLIEHSQTDEISEETKAWTLEDRV